MRDQYDRAAARVRRLPGLALLALVAWATATPVHAQERGPLVLAKSSYFFVGGRIDPMVEGKAPIGQIYVEYMIPQRLRHRTPIVMVHGGGQTGTNFTGTPDGREGWAQYFVRRGYAVYVVDGVARGRSAHWSQARTWTRPMACESFSLSRPSQRRSSSPHRPPPATRHRAMLRPQVPGPSTGRSVALPSTSTPS